MRGVPPVRERLCRNPATRDCAAIGQRDALDAQGATTPSVRHICALYAA